MSKLFCIDGVNCMTGNAPDLPVYARICREYDALLYVDDAHGFGVIGESPEPGHALGPPRQQHRPLLRRAATTTSCWWLGFPSPTLPWLAFLALPTGLKNYLKVAAPPYLYSGPSPTASLATVLAGLRGQRYSRATSSGLDLYRKTKLRPGPGHKLWACLPSTRRASPSSSSLWAHADDIDAVGRFLFERGIYVTLAPYPLVPRSQVGFRIQVTAANDDAEIDQLNDVLAELAERFDMQRAPQPTSP